MKLYWSALVLALTATTLAAQEKSALTRLPLTLTLFTESVSLPDFHNTFSPPHWGVRLGTEIPWSSTEKAGVFQTLNVGYYRHKKFQQGFYVSSEVGFRQFFGNVFADATLGVGYLLLRSDLPRYEPQDNGYQKLTPNLHKFMPTVGVGVGYKMGRMSVFTRYEAFGEMPINHPSAPILPHSALHIGARFQTSAD